MYKRFSFLIWRRRSLSGSMNSRIKFRSKPSRNQRLGNIWFINASLDTAKSQKNQSTVQKIKYDLLIVDEAHKLKNKKTKNWNVNFDQYQVSADAHRYADSGTIWSNCSTWFRFLNPVTWPFRNSKMNSLPNATNVCQELTSARGQVVPPRNVRPLR